MKPKFKLTFVVEVGEVVENEEEHLTALPYSFKNMLQNSELDINLVGEIECQKIS